MKPRGLVGLLGVLALGCCGGAGGSPSPNAVRRPARVMPGDQEVPGWRRVGEGRRFEGSGLYGHIDGGAEVFLELGFEEVRLQGYRKGSDELVVEVYRMRDEIAAIGVYLGNQGAPGRAVPFAERARVGRHQVVFQKQRYYALITNPAGKRELVSEMLAMARNVAGKLPAGSTSVPALDLLPTEGRVAGSLRLIRGRTGLESVYTLGSGDILQLRGEVTAVAASYRDARGGTFTRISVSYGEPALARAAFRNLVTNLDSYLHVVEKGEDRLVFEDYEGKFGEAAVHGRRLDLRVRLAARPSAAAVR